MFLSGVPSCFWTVRLAPTVCQDQSMSRYGIEGRGWLFLPREWKWQVILPKSWKWRSGICMDSKKWADKTVRKSSKANLHIENFWIRQGCWHLTILHKPFYVFWMFPNVVFWPSILHLSSFWGMAPQCVWADGQKVEEEVVPFCLGQLEMT